MTTPSILEVALHCVSQNKSVIPLQYLNTAGLCSCGKVGQCKPGKHPLGRLVPHGLKDASTDIATIKRWFTNTPYNLGLLTGASSGFFVLDRDDRDGGATSLEQLQTKYGALPDTLTQKTGNGMHYFFRIPVDRDVSNSVKKIAAGLDIRGTNGYVVAAPSIHENGTVYQFQRTEIPNFDTITDAPDWLLNRIGAGTEQATAAETPDATMAYAREHGFSWPEQIYDGQGREDFVLRAASHLRTKGLDQQLIEQILLDYNSSHIKPPLPIKDVLDRAQRYENTSSPISAPWPDPVEIANSLPAVPNFDLTILPPPFRLWVMDIAERMQCPAEFLAVGAMVAAGAVVGNRVGVQPKQRDFGWIEVPNLWGAVVGRPGVMKSPALSQVLAPLGRLESKAQDVHLQERAQYELARMQYDADKRSIEAQIKKGVAVNVSQLPIEPLEPQPSRLKVNDATYQKLGQILCGNPRGILAFQDELSGLLMRLDADGQESARAFYLEAWNGQQSYTFDRIERGTLRIPRLCLSLLGGLQPSKLKLYLHSAVHGGKGDDGLAQRLQMLVYPDIPSTWTRVDRLPDLAASQVADQIFEKLNMLDLSKLGAVPAHPDAIPVIRFDDQAQERFNEWWSKLENGLRQSSLAPALESHISKYRKLVPALALLDHLICEASGPIQSESLGRAIKWCKFLLAHAKRAYSSVISTTTDSTQALLRQLRRGVLADGFTQRDVYRKQWSMLGSKREAADAIEMLVDYGWLRVAQDTREISAEGRPTVRYYMHPSLKASA